MGKTYQEFDGHHPLRHFLLHGIGHATIRTARRTAKQVTRTVHYDLNILHKAIHKFQRLRCGSLGLLSRQPVQSLQHRFHIVLSKELLSDFL